MESAQIPMQVEEPPTSELRKALTTVPYGSLAISFTLNFFLLEYLIFTQSSSFSEFFSLVAPFYVWAAIGMDILIAILFGLAMTVIVYRGAKKLSMRGVGLSTLGGLLGFISIGSPVKGGWLDQLGVDQGVAKFPLQGLDIKLLALILLGVALYSGIRRDPVHEGTSEPSSEAQASSSRGWMKSVVLSVTIMTLFVGLPLLPAHWKVDFSKIPDGNQVELVGPQSLDATVLAEINPPEGYSLPIRYEDMGPQLLAAGAIDLERFLQTYENAGSRLSDAQVRILTRGSDETITIDQGNSYFLLNFFWAVGLTNQNPLLELGPMQEFSEGDIGRYASTGGWTLGARPPTELYSSASLISLTPDQQARLERVAANVYRPCCNNPTSFPDCNHGMAMLGMLEWMASKGATETEMFEAAKYLNAFWFPQQALEAATYFQVSEGITFAEVAGEKAVAPDVFSGSGSRNLHSWLESNGLLGQAPSQGGSCGV